MSIWPCASAWGRAWWNKGVRCGRCSGVVVCNQMLQHALFEHQQRSGTVGPRDEPVGKRGGAGAHRAGQAQELRSCASRCPMQRAKLAPVEHEAFQQSVELCGAGSSVGSIFGNGDFCAQVVDQQLHFGGGHHRCALVTFGQQPGLALRVPCERSPPWPERRLSAGKLPEGSGAGGIGDEMDTCRATEVFHAMPPPIVEDPRFAGGHVYRVAVAVEADFRSREDRDVDADARVPVVIDIGMLGYACTGGEAHQPRAAPHHAETGQHLTRIGHRVEPARRQHLAVMTVVFGAVDGDQARGAVARHAVRMSRPGHDRQRDDLGLQPRGVEQHGKLKKGLRQPHEVSSCRSSAHRPAHRAAGRAKVRSGAIA